MPIAGSTIGVDPRMAEYPEQVLPQQRLAAAGGDEELRAELAIQPQHAKARLTAGTTTRFAALAVSVPQTRIGNRLMDMPGARVRSAVTMKLAAPTVVEIPRNTMPRE